VAALGKELAELTKESNLRILPEMHARKAAREWSQVMMVMKVSHA
jgi:hypothetical protein